MFPFHLFFFSISYPSSLTSFEGFTMGVLPSNLSPFGRLGLIAPLMFFVYTFLIPWCGYVMWCILSLFHFILVSMQLFILFPFLGHLFNVFPLFLSPLLVSPISLYPFLSLFFVVLLFSFLTAVSLSYYFFS